MRTLHLVSPHMKGPDVENVQHLLMRHGFYTGKVDGDFGPLTAQAVYRAKYRLGYPKPDQVAGDLLCAYLRGTKRPGKLMGLFALRRARLAAKKKAAAAASLTNGQKLVKLACSQLGQTESPRDSNRSKFSLWYGIIGAWCAMFVTWLHVTAGVGKSFKQGSLYHYVPTIVADARAGRNGLMLASGPASGIVVCFDWPGESPGTADHVGICADEADLRRFAPDALREAIKDFGPLNKSAGDFWTVEGNTAVGNDSNGGEVMIRKRNRSLVQVFVKVAA
jgi:hypothetical protein